jgi:hypothetical protein
MTGNNRFVVKCLAMTDASKRAEARTFSKQRPLRLATVISLTALMFSGISLYETVLRQPSLAIYAAPTWEYHRGPAPSDEFIIAPITIANQGARPGAIISVEMTVSRPAGPAKLFTSSFIAYGDRARQLWAPSAIQGRSAFTAAVIFTTQNSGFTLVEGNGSFDAKLRLRTTYDKSYGLFDDLAYRPTPVGQFALTVKSFDIAALMGDRPVTIAVQASDGTD